MLNEPVDIFRVSINEVEALDPKSLSFAFGIILSNKLILPETEVEDIEEFFKSHSLEGLVRYIDIADILEMDVPAIFRVLRAILRLKYRLTFERSSTIGMNLKEGEKTSVAEFYGLASYLSPDEINLMRTEKYSKAYAHCLSALKKVEKHLDMEAKLQGEEQ